MNSYKNNKTTTTLSTTTTTRKEPQNSWVVTLLYLAQLSYYDLSNHQVRTRGLSSCWFQRCMGGGGWGRVTEMYQILLTIYMDASVVILNIWPLIIRIRIYSLYLADQTSLPAVYCHHHKWQQLHVQDTDLPPPGTGHHDAGHDFHGQEGPQQGFRWGWSHVLILFITFLYYFIWLKGPYWWQRWWQWWYSWCWWWGWWWRWHIRWRGKEFL